MDNQIDALQQPDNHMWYGVFRTYDDMDSLALAILSDEKAANDYVAQYLKQNELEPDSDCLCVCPVKLGGKVWNSYEEPSAKFAALDMSSELERLEALLNTPEIEDFLKGVKLEAAHQVERWGPQHDTGKHPGDWALLFARQIGKMSEDVYRKDTEKYKHHLITLAAIAFNCHRNQK